MSFDYSHSFDNQDSTATQSKKSHRVILFNDEYHTYNYVVEMLTKVCKLGKENAFRCAVEVDLTGKTIVYYGTHGECLDLQSQIVCFGPDHRLPQSLSSMDAEVESF